MFKNIPDLENAILVLFVGTMIGITLGAYELIRLFLYIYNHLTINWSQIASISTRHIPTESARH